MKAIVDDLRQRCSAVYNPGPNLSVDEAFKGECIHSHIVQIHTHIQVIHYSA